MVKRLLKQIEDLKSSDEITIAVNSCNKILEKYGMEVAMLGSSGRNKSNRYSILASDGKLYRNSTINNILQVQKKLRKNGGGL